MPGAMTVESLYEQHIKRMPVRDRLRLMAMVANDLTNMPEESAIHRVSPGVAHPEQTADFQMEVTEAQGAASRPNTAPLAGSIRFMGDVESPIDERWDADS